MPKKCESCEERFLKKGLCDDCDRDVFMCAGEGCNVDLRYYKGKTVTCGGHPGVFCEDCIPRYYLDDATGASLGSLCTECQYRLANEDHAEILDIERRFEKLLEKRKKIDASK